MMFRRRFRRDRGAASAKLAGDPRARAALEAVAPPRPALPKDAGATLFQDDANAQRLFNRQALEGMGEYGAVILASDSLRPAWAEAGDLASVRRGAEDAAKIARDVTASRQRRK